MKSTIGLALGGGGARGLAHLGVLKVLEEEGINIGCIAGTSMGAIVGAMYAQKPDADALIKTFRDFLFTQNYESLGLKYVVPESEQNATFLQHIARVVAKRVAISIAQSRTALLKVERLSNAISYLMGEGRIQDTEIPFGAVATDLNTMESVFIQEGSIKQAVLLSSSIPGFIPPNSDGKQLITDGGVSDPVPVEFVRKMGADIIIGVCVGIKKISPLKNPNVIDIIARTHSIRGYHLTKFLLNEADIALHPDVRNAHWSEFLKIDEFIDAGIRETRSKLPQIRKIIAKKSNPIKRLFYNRNRSTNKD